MRVLVLGNSGAGGDWPPLASVMQGLHERGHEVTVLGDETLASALSGTGIPVETLPAEMDLYPLILAYNDRIDEGRPGGLPDAEWAEQCLPRVREIVDRREPDLIVSQLFTIDLAARLKADCGLTWCFVNPAYYFGKHCLRPLEEDYVGASHRLAVAWTAGPRPLRCLASNSRLTGSSHFTLTSSQWTSSCFIDALSRARLTAMLMSRPPRTPRSAGRRPGRGC